MSQRSTSCWIRRCNRQYIFLPQFTIVSRCRARDEKFLSWTRYASSICDRRELSLFTASAAAGLKPRGADDRPNSLKKRDKQERSFSPRKAHNERTPFPREQSARALSLNAQVVCVIWCQKCWHGSAHLLKRFIILTLQKQSPWREKRGWCVPQVPFLCSQTLISLRHWRPPANVKCIGCL